MARLKLIEYRLHKAMSLNVGRRMNSDLASPPKLKLIFKKKHIREYRIDRGMSLTIGRRVNNDIVIHDSTVSREHARVEYSDGRYLVTDLRSKNGTFVNKALIASHWLDHGDILKIGKHHLVFAYDKEELDALGKFDPAEDGLVIDVEPGKELRRPDESSAETRLPEIEAQPMSTLWFLTGGEGEIKLTKELLKVGKDSACDIVVPGLFMGKVAFTIGRRPTGYYLNYIGGAYVPRVNGQPVKRSMKLEESDIIDIRTTKLQFFMGKRDEADFAYARSIYERIFDQ
jgi:pSer/pThr/pTyr-binding forkhead associated (FHA) protein